MHPQRQFGIADSTLFLKKGQDPAVYCIKIGHDGIFFDRRADFHRFLRLTGIIRPNLRSTLRQAGATLAQNKGRMT